MTNARIRQRYGFGAARLCVYAPIGATPQTITLREAVVEVASVRAVLRALPGIAALVFVAMVMAAMLRRASPEEVWLELVRVVPEPQLPLPELVPELPPRLLPAEPGARPKPEASPPVAAVAPPPTRTAPAVPEAPPLEPPKLRIDPVALPQPAAPARPPQAPPVRTPARRPAPPRGLSLPAASDPVPSATPRLATRRAAPDARAPRRAARPAPAVAAVPSLASSLEVGEPRPSTRRPSQAPPTRRASRAPVPRSVVPASLAAAAEIPRNRGESLRAAFASESRPGPRREAPDAGVAGVPLASLASCLTDREENQLKLEVLSVLEGRRECASRSGRYRFVETRNLGAFLMWIERASSRGQGDRCAELRLALECLGAPGPVGARK